MAKNASLPLPRPPSDGRQSLSVDAFSKVMEAMLTVPDDPKVPPWMCDEARTMIVEILGLMNIGALDRKRVERTLAAYRGVRAGSETDVLQALSGIAELGQSLARRRTNVRMAAYVLRVQVHDRFGFDLDQAVVEHALASHRDDRTTDGLAAELRSLMPVDGGAIGSKTKSAVNRAKTARRRARN